MVRSFSRFIDVERPTAESRQHVVLLLLPLVEASARLSGSGGGDSIERGEVDIVRMGGPGNVNDTHGQLHIHATMKQILHFRYQSPGCDASPQQQQQQRGITCGLQCSPSSPFYHTAADVSYWGRSASAAVPYFSGCYATTHLPQPKVYIRCSAENSTFISPNAASTLRQLRAALSAGDHPIDEHHRWASIPVVNPSHPDFDGYDASCTPPLAAVPVGGRSHAVFVHAVTVAVALACSLAILASVWAVANGPMETHFPVRVLETRAMTYVFEVSAPASPHREHAHVIDAAEAAARLDGAVDGIGMSFLGIAARDGHGADIDRSRNTLRIGASNNARTTAAASASTAQRNGRRSSSGR